MTCNEELSATPNPASQQHKDHAAGVRTTFNIQGPWPVDSATKLAAYFMSLNLAADILAEDSSSRCQPPRCRLLKPQGTLQSSCKGRSCRAPLASGGSHECSRSREDVLPSVLSALEHGRHGLRIPEAGSHHLSTVMQNKTGSRACASCSG